MSILLITRSLESVETGLCHKHMGYKDKISFLLNLLDKPENIWTESRKALRDWTHLKLSSSGFKRGTQTWRRRVTWHKNVCGQRQTYTGAKRGSKKLYCKLSAVSKTPPRAKSGNLPFSFLSASNLAARSFSSSCTRDSVKG